MGFKSTAYGLPGSLASQAATVAFVKPARGSNAYQENSSSRPRLYTRHAIGEETASAAIRTGNGISGYSSEDPGHDHLLFDFDLSQWAGTTD